MGARAFPSPAKKRGSKMFRCCSPDTHTRRTAVQFTLLVLASCAVLASVTFVGALHAMPSKSYAVMQMIRGEVPVTDLMIGVEDITWNGTNNFAAASDEALHTVDYTFFSQRAYPSQLRFTGLGGAVAAGLVLFAWAVVLMLLAVRMVAQKKMGSAWRSACCAMDEGGCGVELVWLNTEDLPITHAPGIRRTWALLALAIFFCVGLLCVEITIASFTVARAITVTRFLPTVIRFHAQEAEMLRDYSVSASGSGFAIDNFAAATEVLRAAYAAYDEILIKGRLQLEVINATARAAEAICCTELRAKIEDLNYFFEVEARQNILDPAFSTLAAASDLVVRAQGSVPGLHLAAELLLPTIELSEVCHKVESAVTLALLPPLQWLYAWATYGLLLVVVGVGPAQWLFGFISAGLYHFNSNGRPMLNQSRRMLCVGAHGRAQAGFLSAFLMLTCAAATSVGVVLLTDMYAIVSASSSGTLDTETRDSPLLRAAELHAACRADRESTLLTPLLTRSAGAILPTASPLRSPPSLPARAAV